MTTSRCHRVCHCRGSLRLILVARTDSRDRESAMPPGRRLLGVGSALRVCGARSGPARPSPGQGRIRVASESSPAAAARVTLPMTSHGGGHHHDSVTGRRTRHSRPGTRGPSQCHDLSHDSNDGSIRSHDGESLSLSLPSPRRAGPGRARCQAGRTREADSHPAGPGHRPIRMARPDRSSKAPCAGARRRSRWRPRPAA